MVNDRDHFDGTSSISVDHRIWDSRRPITANLSTFAQPLILKFMITCFPVSTSAESIARRCFYWLYENLFLFDLYPVLAFIYRSVFEQTDTVVISSEVCFMRVECLHNWSDCRLLWMPMDKYPGVHLLSPIQQLYKTSSERDIYGSNFICDEIKL